MKEKQKHIATLDSLWRSIVKDRDGGRCKIHGCNQAPVEAHHIFGRGHAVRWDIRNGISLCTDHHTGWVHNGGEKEFLTKLRADWGENAFDELEMLSRKVMHFKNYDLIDLIKELKDIRFKMLMSL